VAPLKRNLRRHESASQPIVFPRLKKRGSIEAAVYQPRQPRQSLFPRLKKRGSIEALKSGLPRLMKVLFPRLKKRGSIEAAIVR